MKREEGDLEEAANLLMTHQGQLPKVTLKIIKFFNRGMEVKLPTH